MQFIRDHTPNAYILVGSRNILAIRRPGQRADIPTDLALERDLYGPCCGLPDLDQAAAIRAGEQVAIWRPGHNVRPLPGIEASPARGIPDGDAIIYATRRDIFAIR